MIEEVRARSEPYMSNGEMGKILGRVKALLRVSGAKTRRWRANGERSTDHAKKAGAEALERAGLKPSDIDLLIYVGVGRGWVEPGMASFFQHELGLTNATCFDILDACLSWLRALHVSCNFLQNGVYKNIMVLNAEFNTEFGDYTIKSLDEVQYKFAQLTIGESATATILSNGQNGVTPHFVFKTDASRHNLCKIPLPQIGRYSSKEKCPQLSPLIFFAYSADLFTAAQEMIPATYFSSAELRDREFDIAFAHTPSKPVVDNIEKDLQCVGRTVNLYPEFGNTVSATIPTAMSWAIENGRLERGQKVLMVMGSAGFSVGLAHMAY
jgi:3-oxoacyl-[acyl-carrier-protein] synthase III